MWTRYVLYVLSVVVSERSHHHTYLVLYLDIDLELEPSTSTLHVVPRHQSGPRNCSVFTYICSSPGCQCQGPALSATCGLTCGHRESTSHLSAISALDKPSHTAGWYARLNCTLCGRTAAVCDNLASSQVSLPHYPGDCYISSETSSLNHKSWRRLQYSFTHRLPPSSASI